MLMPEGARYQAVKPHHQRVEDNAFHLSANELSGSASPATISIKQAARLHFRNVKSGNSRITSRVPALQSQIAL
jgi:hypothetical protein